jgi:hypothetical protein
MNVLKKTLSVVMAVVMLTLVLTACQDNNSGSSRDRDRDRDRDRSTTAGDNGDNATTASYTPTEPDVTTAATPSGEINMGNCVQCSQNREVCDSCGWCEECDYVSWCRNCRRGTDCCVCGNQDVDPGELVSFSQLVGTWECNTGMIWFWYDRLVIEADGSFTSNDDEKQGTLTLNENTITFSFTGGGTESMSATLIGDTMRVTLTNGNYANLGRQ